MFGEAYNEANHTGGSVFLIPERNPTGVTWRQGTAQQFAKAREENVYPIELHRGSFGLVSKVKQEASLISDFTNTWDNVLSQANPVKPIEQAPVQTQTATVNVGRGTKQGSMVSLSNYRQGQMQAGDNGWLGNPYNVSVNPKNTWQVTTEQDRWAGYANLLLKTLSQDDNARKAFMALQGKELSSTTKGETNESHIIKGLLNELEGKDDNETKQILDNLAYDGNGFSVKPQAQKQASAIPLGDIQTAKANNGFYVGRYAKDGKFNSLGSLKRFPSRIGQQGWLGNPYNTSPNAKKYQVKTKEEGLHKYTLDLKGLLLDNDKALTAFLALQGKQLYKGVNGDTEAEVVAQILKAVKGKTKEEAQQIIASITGFRDGQVQFQEATNSGRKKEGLHQTPSRETVNVPSGDTKQQKTSDADSQNQAKPFFGERKGLANLPDVPVISIDTKALGFKDSKKLADDILRTLQTAPIGTLHNKDTGWDLVVGKKDRKKMGNNKQLSHNTSQAIQGIEALVDNAILVETHQDDKHNNTNVIAVHRLYVPAMIDGQLNRVKLTVKDYVLTDGSERKNLHAIEAVEIETPFTGNSTIQPVDSSTNHKGGKLSIEQLLTGVNRDGDGKPFSIGLDNDPFAHLTDDDIARANAQVESVRENEAERQALQMELDLAEANNENLDPDYYNDYDTGGNKETAEPPKKSLKDKVKVKVKVKAELTGVKPLNQVIDDLGLDSDSLMIAKAISELYELKVSFDGTTGKDIVSADNLVKELIAYSTGEVLSQLKQNTDDKKLGELKDSINVIKDKLKTIDSSPKLIREALDSDYNLVAMAVTNADFKNILMGIEHTQKIHKNLFSKLIYGLMSVFGIPNKTSVNNLYEKTLTTLGDLIQYQASNNQSLRAGNLSVLQNVDRSAELAKPILAKMAGEEQNLIKAGITQGIKKPLASIKNLSIKLASDGLSVLAHDKPTDKQLAQLEHFLAFKNEMAELLQQALPKDNYSNWDYRDLKQALIREGIDDNLLTAMALSAYDKILADGGKTFHSRDDVAKLLGFKPEQVDIPHNVHHKFLHIHAHLPSFATDLGKQITGTLELSQTKDVPAQTLARLEASLGNWLVSALQIGGYVHTITMPKNEYEDYKAQVEDKEAVVGDDKAILTFVSFTDVDGNNKSELIEEIQEVSKETGGYLAKLFGADSFKRYPKMDKPTNVKDKIRKTKSKVSTDQAKKIDKAQQEAIYINQAMEKVLKALGDDVQEMLGAVVTEEELAKLHISKRKGAKERAEAIARELDNHKEWSAFVGDKPFYDTVTVAVNKRMHYDSNVWNFQSSTVQRAFGEPESFRVTLPLDTGFVDDKGKPTAMGLFMRAVFENAEGTEGYFEERLNDKYPKGWTVDKLPTTDFIEVALDYIKEPRVQKAITAMQKTQQGETLSADDIQSIKDIVKEWQMEARSLRALMELANFSYAMANGKEFTTSLGLGSDGVNNGIGIAHVLMGINDELTLAQVGILKEQYPSYFATRTDKNVGDYYESFGVALYNGISQAYAGIRHHKKWNDKFKQIMLDKAHAIEQLSTTLKKRATYKAIIIPFGYGAGFSRLQEAASEQMISDITNTLEKIYHEKDTKLYKKTNEHLQTLLKDFSLPPMDKLLEFEFDKGQLYALKQSHQAFLGRAIKNALQEYAGEFIERRTAFIQMQEMASTGFVKAKEVITDKVLKEHQDNIASTNEFAKRAIDYIGLDGHQLDELENKLAPVRPKVESIYSLKSGSDDTAKIQLTTNERTLVTDVTEGKTKQLHDGELVNKSTSLLTQAIKETSNGVTPNSQTVQSTDSYVSSEAMVAEGVVSINVHDANIAGLIHYFTMAMTQNKAFFYGTAIYHLGYQNIKTLVDTLTGIQTLGLTDKELSDIHQTMADSLGEEFDFGGNTLAKDKLKFYVNEMLQTQINNDLSKLDMYLGMTTIHQYAGENGEYKLTQKDYDFLNQEKKHLLELKDKLQKQIDEVFGENNQQAQNETKQADNTLQTKVNEFIDKALSENDPRGELELFAVSDKEVQIAKDSGLDIAGLSHVLDANALKHAIKKHGNDSSKEKSQRDLTVNDLKRIPEVLKDFDNLKVQQKGTNLSSLVYSKKFADGRVEYVERVIETSKKSTPRLSTKTVWVKSATGVKSSLPQVSTPDRQGDNSKTIKDNQPITFKFDPVGIAGSGLFTKAKPQINDAIAKGVTIVTRPSGQLTSAYHADALLVSYLSKNGYTEVKEGLWQKTDKFTDKNQTQNSTKSNTTNGVSIDKFFDKKVLDTYAKDAKDGQKDLYQMLVPLLPKDIKFATGTLPNPKAIAGFIGDTIVFNAEALRGLSATDKMRYVNHEIVHALTEYGLSKDTKASQDLQAMYEQLKPLANTPKLKLAFENVNEFVAYGLTDKAIQAFILDKLDTKALGIKTPSKIKDALDNFLKAVFSLFGLNKSASYKTFVSAVDKIIQEGLGKATDIQQPRYSQSPMKDTNANFTRGQQAMHKAITSKADVKRAMYRNDIGWIDFVWGDEGVVKASGKTKGGKGIAHIIEARSRKNEMSENDIISFLTQNVIGTIAYGTVHNRIENQDEIKVSIDYKNTRVVLVKEQTSNAWIVTAFERSNGGQGVGFDTSQPTHTLPTHTRQDVGASDQDSITDDTNIRYAQTTATDSFKQLDKGKVSDDFNNHLDGLIDRFIGSYDKADAVKIDKLATDGLPPNAKLLQLGLSSKEAHVIQALTLVYTAYLKDNGVLASNRLKDLYKDAQKQFRTAKDLYPDYDTMDNQGKLLARNVHQFVFNNKTKDDNVARFMALTLGSEQFKALIDSHQIKKTKDTDTWFDKTMLAMQTVLDWFIAKTFKSTGSQSEQIQGLLKHLAKLEADSRLSVSDKIQGNYEQGFRFVFNPLNKAVKTVLAKTFDNEVVINSRFGWLQTVGRAAKFMNSDKRDEVAQDFVAQMQGGMFAGRRMNTVMETLNELTLQGVRGKVIDATTRITQKKGQERQQVEANTYKALKDSFSHTTKEENIAVTHALIKTDIQALLTAGFSVNEAVALLDDTKRQKTIERYQARLKEQIKDTKQFNTTMHAINSLGLYMATGITSLHLQKNSDNIARGIGTWYSTDKLDTDKAKTIDVLATLYALNHTESNKLKVIQELYQREPEGVSRTLYLHQDMVKKGKEDFASNPLNYQKGYISQLFNPYSKVVFVTSLEEQMELEKKGFETIGELDQDPLDKKETSILMIDKFHSPNNYVSGMLDMYDTSHKGTEVYNSRTEPKAINKIVNEKIAQMEKMAHLPVDKVNPMDTQGALIANYNTDQTIDNYRYEMSDKSKETLLEQDMDFIHILSAQNANLVYKPEIKQQQIKSANIVIEDAKNFKKYPSQYVLLDFNNPDPAVQQMMALIPYPFRAELEAHFGKGNPIPIHSTMYNALFGFRAYSLVEAFDKLDNPYAKLNFAERALTGTMKLLFKDKARHHTLLIEKVVQTAMSYIKEAIVVKSGGVLMGNIIQNLWLLAMHGINPLQIAHGVIGAWRNSKRFTTDANRLTELEVLTKSTKDKHKISAYKRQMKTLQERLDSNPMKPFMDAGMMSTIVEDLAMQEETRFKSHYEQKIATVTDKIPDFIKTPVNLLMVNKGSLPYQFLAEATQFSDLAAKFVLTEHHYKNQVKKGVNKNKAMTDAIYLAQESFVNYDIPTSRTLDYLNRVGLMVFTKFWLRFQKALFRFAIHAPAQSFVMNEVAEQMTGTSIYDPFLLARLGNNPFDGSLLLADDAVGNLITTSVLF